jgi:phosphoribosylanthranilate isomerase
MNQKIPVKICGLSNVIDALTAAESGAAALGFVMGGKVLPPEVEPRAQDVREIIKRLPPGVDSYLVTHLLAADDILALADYLGVTGIQVSEDVGAMVMHDLRERTSRKIIKTIVADPTTAFAKLDEYAPTSDYFLLDSRVGGYVGGTGATNDWELCRRLVEAAKCPVWLAGGLNPDNLPGALAQVRPYGADVSTGISAYGPGYWRKDRKDPAKIRKFISLAQSPAL